VSQVVNPISESITVSTAPPATAAYGSSFTVVALQLLNCRLRSCCQRQRLLCFKPNAYQRAVHGWAKEKHDVHGYSGAGG